MPMVLFDACRGSDVTKGVSAIIAILTSLSLGLGLSLYTEHRKRLALTDMVERMTVDGDSPLAMRAAYIHKKFTFISIEDTKNLFVKQLFYLGDFPCVQYFPVSQTAKDGRSTYCFSDIQGTRLILNSDKHLLD